MKIMKERRGQESGNKYSVHKEFLEIIGNWNQRAVCARRQL